MWFFWKIFGSDGGISGDKGQVPSDDVGVYFSFLFSQESGKNNIQRRSKCKISDWKLLSNKELSTGQMSLNNLKELMNILGYQGSLNLFTIPRYNKRRNSSLELTSQHIKPLINKRLIMRVLATIELVLRVGQESDDGVGWEECALRGLEKGKGVEGWDGGEIGGGLVGDLLDGDLEGVDDGFDFAVTVVDGGLCAVVEFH